MTYACVHALSERERVCVCVCVCLHRVYIELWRDEGRHDIRMCARTEHVTYAHMHAHMYALTHAHICMH